MEAAGGPLQADRQPEPRRLEGPGRPGRPAARGRGGRLRPARQRATDLPRPQRGPGGRHDRVGQARAAVGLDDPNQRIGRGLTDHPILYTHFALPAGSPHAATGASAKIWSRHRDTSVDRHAYNVVLELGADFNQGRYVDPDNLARQRAEKGDQTLCEIVFLFNAPLLEGNFLELAGPPAVPVRVNVQPYRPPDALRAGTPGWPPPCSRAWVRWRRSGRTWPSASRPRRRRPRGRHAPHGRRRHHGRRPQPALPRLRQPVRLRQLGVPEPPAANPTLALTALALRLARHSPATPEREAAG